MPRAAAASESTVAEPLVAEAEGFRLHLSNKNGTGYRGVHKHSCGRFQAQHSVGGREVYLGTFDTEVEAAVAFARHVQSPAAASATVGAKPCEATAARLVTDGKEPGSADEMGDAPHDVPHAEATVAAAASRRQQQATEADDRSRRQQQQQQGGGSSSRRQP